jgi:adenosylmethionine-8-amino-7-oxononanoate aminotransferase
VRDKVPTVYGQVHHLFSDFGVYERYFPGDYPKVITHGKGKYLYERGGHRVLDFSQHLGACNVGHADKRIIEAMTAQLNRLEFSSLDMGLTHPRVLELGAKLSEKSPIEDSQFVLCSSGSEAVEIAIKIALQYQRVRSSRDRPIVLSRYDSYHGSTHVAASLGGRRNATPTATRGEPGFVSVRVDGPGPQVTASGSLSSVDPAAALEMEIQRLGPETVGAFVAEPMSIFGGVKPPTEEYWKAVRNICDRHGILLIADETITAFGRTGKFFGSERWNIKPDILTMAKGMTSGYFPMGAVAVTAGVLRAISEFSHNNTWAGHPVGCAAALATIDILEKERLVERVLTLEPVLSLYLRDLRALSSVIEVSCLGLAASVTIDQWPVASEERTFRLLQLRDRCYQAGLLIRGIVMGTDIVIVMYPPFIVGDEDLRTAVDILSDAIDAVCV